MLKILHHKFTLFVKRLELVVDGEGEKGWRPHNGESYNPLLKGGDRL